MNKGTLLSIALSMLFVVPAIALAQTGGDPSQALVPCGGVDCNLQSFATLIQRLLNFSIFLAAIISACLFAYAGFLFMTAYSTGSENDVHTAKEMLWHVVIGFFIILGAWLIIDTLLGTLISKSFGPWNLLNG